MITCVADSTPPNAAYEFHKKYLLNATGALVGSVALLDKTLEGYFLSWHYKDSQPTVYQIFN